MTDFTHLDNAPLINTECQFEWDTRNSSVAIKPDDLREAIGRDQNYNDPIFEWLIPKNLMDSADDDTPLFRVTYKSSDTVYKLILTKCAANIKCDSSYETWQEFRAQALGYQRMLRSIVPNDLVLDNIALRYVDAYTKDLLQEKTPAEFLREDLQVDINLPDSVHRILDDGSNESFFIKNLMELPNSRRVQLSIGAAQVRPQEDDASKSIDAAVCDIIAMKYNISKTINSDDILDDLHGIQHNLFAALTEPIQTRLR